MTVLFLFTIVIIVLVIGIVFASYIIVPQQSVFIIERFGKFNTQCEAGLHFKIPVVDQCAGLVSLRLMQLDIKVETKTLDDVFVDITTSVQYRVLPHKIFDAFYTLDDPEKQIKAFVFDVVRSRVPKIKLDDVFSTKDDIALSVRDELKEVMNNFGYDITQTLVTDIMPDAKVKAAMNEINEAQRLRIAANERGEAEKILKVKQAEAEAESKALHGKGISWQRKAIMDGLKDSLCDFQAQIPGADHDAIMHLILMTQYFDTLKEMGVGGKMNTIMVPYSPGSVSDIGQQLKEAMVFGKNLPNMDGTNSTPGQKASKVEGPGFF
ncbi:MAG: SPFH domain-containing protein [Alphaproteobacteria bacterium]|nr:SPFH domain-containing protein [Alphaproteobacteria bacterium]